MFVPLLLGTRASDYSHNAMVHCGEQATRFFGDWSFGELTTANSAAALLGN